jgi:hypothetical protein
VDIHSEYIPSIYILLSYFIEDEIWERGNGGQIEIPDEHQTILGYTGIQKNLKQDSQDSQNRVV